MEMCWLRNRVRASSLQAHALLLSKFLVTLRLYLPGSSQQWEWKTFISMFLLPTYDLLPFAQQPTLDAQTMEENHTSMERYSRLI